MKQKDKTKIDRANETIRRNREARRRAARSTELPLPEMAFDVANCANAFAKSGNKASHLFDKLF